VDECDDGNDVNDDACTNLCKNAKCGDMIVQPIKMEQCDDGNDNDDCVMCKHTCGDGVTNFDDECDDGNAKDDDFCDTKCMKAAYRVFVTQGKFDGDWGGTSGADVLCNTAAMMLPNAGKYKAWLSDDNNQPKDDFDKSSLPYRRLDNMKVANNWADLSDGSLSAPISQTETGMVLGGADNSCNNNDRLVWTNTKPDGAKDSEPHCDDWNKSDQTNGGLGNALQVNAGWTEGCEKACNTTARLYCFEQP